MSRRKRLYMGVQIEFHMRKQIISRRGKWVAYRLKIFPNRKTIFNHTLTPTSKHHGGRVIVWFWWTEMLKGNLFKNDTIKVICECFSWIVQKTGKKLTVFSSRTLNHPCLARWQRVPTTSLAAAFKNEHHRNLNPQKSPLGDLWRFKLVDIPLLISNQWALQTK